MEIPILSKSQNEVHYIGVCDNFLVEKLTGMFVFPFSPVDLSKICLHLVYIMF